MEGNKAKDKAGEEDSGIAGILLGWLDAHNRCLSSHNEGDGGVIPLTYSIIFVVYRATAYFSRAGGHSRSAAFI